MNVHQRVYTADLWFKSQRPRHGSYRSRTVCLQVEFEFKIALSSCPLIHSPHPYFYLARKDLREHALVWRCLFSVAFDPPVSRTDYTFSFPRCYCPTLLLPPSSSIRNSLWIVDGYLTLSDSVRIHLIWNGLHVLGTRKYGILGKSFSEKNEDSADIGRT